MKQWVYTDYHLEYCRTDQQREIISRRIRGYSWRDIGKELGCDYGNCQKNAQVVYRRAAKQGYDPANHLEKPLSPGQSLQGVTTLYKFNEHGQKVPAMQWSSATRHSQAETPTQPVRVMSHGERSTPSPITKTTAR